MLVAFCRTIYKIIQILLDNNAYSIDLFDSNELISEWKKYGGH